MRFYDTEAGAQCVGAFFQACVRGGGAGFRRELRKTGTRVPVVLSKPETQRLFEKLETPDGRYELAARLQYGAGLRNSELVRLRVQDVDVGRGTVTVRQGKGDKDYPRFQRRSAECITAPPQSWRWMRRYRVRGSGSRCCRRACGRRSRDRSSGRGRSG